MKPPAALVLVALAVTSPLQAELFNGQTVRTENRQFFPHSGFGAGNVADSVVGPGIELTNFGFPGALGGTQSLTIDFSDTNILITVNQLATLDSFLHFQDFFGTIPRFTSVTVNPATNFPNFTPSTFIYFEPNLIRLILPPGGLGGEGKQISLDVTVIPEPATSSPVLSAIAYVFMRRKRRSQK